MIQLIKIFKKYKTHDYDEIAFEIFIKILEFIKKSLSFM
jgi:hypothetical protein